MFSFLQKDSLDLLSSQLYNEQSFFPAFVADARRATETIIVESPFITYRRLKLLYPTLERAVMGGVRIVVNTRDPQFQDGSMRQQATAGIAALQDIGIEVLFTSNLHRKLAIIDHHILWEGSLNILSQIDSCEVMRRTESAILAEKMIQFLHIKQYHI